MTTFKDFDDTAEISTPDNLEMLAKGKIVRRARTQRTIAAGLVSVLIVAFAGVAFGFASGGTNGSVDTADQRDRQELKDATSTSNSVVDSPVTSSTSLSGNDDVEYDDQSNSVTVSTRDDDDDITSTSSPDDDDDEIEDESGDDNSGSGSSGSGSDD